MVFASAVVISVVVFMLYWAYQFSHRTFQMKTSIKVYPQTHLQELANNLQARRLWNHPEAFLMLARLHGFSGNLRYGEYQILPDMTPQQLLQNIHDSRGLVKHAFRIHEGWTVKQLDDALREDSNIKYKNTKLGKDLEGMVYPDTYSFAWGVSSDRVINHGQDRMQQILDQAWQNRVKSIPITTPQQALIVASLIQTEASNVSERPKVAAVIYNRLRRGMRLQIDPTVMYGLGLPYGSILTKRQLEQATPYNTYKIEGLPPTPIAFPTRTAIEAALHPAKISSLYYVANGDGTHTFSDNYHTHKKAVEKYRAFLNQKKWEQQKEALKVIVEDGIF
jgi:UPF0755 protein